MKKAPRHTPLALTASILLALTTAGSIADIARGENVDSEQAGIEQDWRMQDGIGTERIPSTYYDAIALSLDRGDRLVADLQEGGTRLGDLVANWEQCRVEWKSLGESNGAPHWEELWRRVHQLRRDIALRNPLVQISPLVFIKQAPSIFSHQLTQYYGSCTAPGGEFMCWRARESR